MQIRSGPATVSAEEGSKYATGAIALGRQLPSKEARARRPAEFTSIRIDLEGKVDNDSGIRPNKSASRRPRSGLFVVLFIRPVPLSLSTRCELFPLQRLLTFQWIHPRTGAASIGICMR